MPDFASFVRQHVAPLALPGPRQQKIVEEWAAQLEDAYEALRADGLSDEEAWIELRRQVADWKALGGELLEGEPALVRIVNPQHGPLATPLTRSLAASLRETLTNGFLRDVRGGFRWLVTDRGFSASIILTLAVCLGANAAIFTVVHAVLLRPLQVPEPDRIVAFGDVYPTITPNDTLSNDVPSYFDRLAALTTLDSQALFTFWFDTVAIDGVPEELRGMRATPSLFRVLNVAPALGRTFTEDEGDAGHEYKVVLSHGLWQRLYGGDPAAIGQTLRLGWTGQPYTIVGVMPAGFSFFDLGYDGHARTTSRDLAFWIPLAFSPAQRSEAARTTYGYFHIGRLRPGATTEQVQAQVDTLHAATVARFPQFRFAELGMYTLVTPLQEALTRGLRRTLYLLWAGAGMVLLIGAINIANLALARAGARARELATRLALGAGQFAITRQLIVEALVPAAIGGAAGVAVAAAILRGLASTGLNDLPNAAHIRIDLTVIGAVALASVVLGLVVGMTPALTARAAAINQAIAGGTRTGTSGRRARLFRRGLVVAQVAFSVVLLIAATLLFTSFRHLLAVDAGFSAAHVTTATIFPPPSRYPDAASVVRLSDRLLDRLRAIPGVEAAGTTTNIALSGSASPATISTAQAASNGEPPAVPSVVAVSPGYFEAMKTPLVAGRYFSRADGEQAMRVAIVDERLAARLWPGETALGKAISRGTAGPFTVVGVVREVRFESVARLPESSIGTAYFPHSQAPPMRRLRWLAIRTTQEARVIARDVRAVLLDIDPDLPLSDVQTMSERTSSSLVSESLAATLASMFALVALFLSLLGIYSVLAHVVARRTREFGIRMALGSSVRGVFQLVIKEGIALVAAGLVIGVGGALAVGRAIESQLFGVAATDPVLLGSVVAGTAVIALAACLVPARRATRVDPVRVLSEQ